MSQQTQKVNASFQGIRKKLKWCVLTLALVIILNESRQLISDNQSESAKDSGFQNTPTAIKMAESLSLRERYEASMVLSGVGDALGYKNGNWEFCHSGRAIHDELKNQFNGSVDNILVKKPDWPVSDDTVMHLATATALAAVKEHGPVMFQRLAKEYKECMKDMAGRAPGNTCMDAVHQLKPLRPDGYRIKFNPRGGGCGAAMRAMCIGLRYPKPEDLDNLITVSVESGRMTHNNPTGYLGALASALFVSYSLQEKPVNAWGKGLLDTLPKAFEYIKKVGIDVKENKETWEYFTEKWTEYLKERGIEDGSSEPKFPEKYGIEERDKFYKSRSFSGWGGSSGHDAPMIAYDALLSYDGTWADLCSRAMFHSGDSDSTAVIAAACYGAMFGYKDVHKNNYEELEYRSRLAKLSQKIYVLAYPEDKELKKKIEQEDNEAEKLLAKSPEVPQEDEVAKINIPHQMSVEEQEMGEVDIEKRLEDIKENK